jgi:hypothetical protein
VSLFTVFGVFIIAGIVLWLTNTYNDMDRKIERSMECEYERSDPLRHSAFRILHSAVILRK